jgi:hypothetical protein
VRPHRHGLQSSDIRGVRLIEPSLAHLAMDGGTAPRHGAHGVASSVPRGAAIVLEGGIDGQDRFFFIPIGAGAGLCEAWRRKVVALFLDKDC